MLIRARITQLLFGLLLITGALLTSARAQGVIVPGICDDCPRPPRPVQLPRSLPIKSIKLDTKIAALVKQNKSLDEIKQSLGEAAKPGVPPPRFPTYTDTTYEELTKK